MIRSWAFWFVTDLDIRQFSFPQFPIGVEYLLNFDGFRGNLANLRELVPASRLASAALGGSQGRYRAWRCKVQCYQGLCCWTCSYRSAGRSPMITGLGVVFLPLCLWFWRTPIRLLQLVFIGAVFGAGAAVVLGSYGIAPALIPAALFIGTFVLRLLDGVRYPAEKLSWSA